MSRAQPTLAALLLSALMAAASGCATVKTAGDTNTARGGGLSEILTQDIGDPANAGPARRASMTSSGDIVIQGVKLKNTQFDIPITINSAVEQWVDYFTGRGRKHFDTYLARSEYFIPYILPILKQSGMPEDLVYLAMIESGFNNFAASHAKAVGAWQFISATGKRYGLMVNWWVDERRDVRKSTLAAIEYLRDLYQMFGSWELAAASYNAGEAKVARAIQRFGTKDFWTLARHRFLRSETRNYVPKMIAAALVAKNRELFGFKPSGHGAAAPDEVVAGDGEVVKVVKTDKPEESLEKDAKETLAALSQGRDDDSDDDDDLDGPRLTPALLNVPVAGAPADSTMAQTEPQPLAKSVPTPHLTKKGEIGGAELTEFEVQSPADLLKVARAAGLSYQTVKSLNPELLRWCTPPTVGTYRIKLPSSTKDKFLATYNHSAYPRKVQFMTYKVRRGETLARIATHYGIKVDPISDLNGVSPRMPLRTGVRVLLPIPNDRSRSLASLEIRDAPDRRRRARGRRGAPRFYKISYKKRESARSSRHEKDEG